jgi:PAS domain S-box-containing protein
MESGGGSVPAAAETTSRSTWKAFFSALPKGQSLTDEVWILRHRVIVGLVFAHAFALFLFGVIRGYETFHVGLEVSVIFVLGLVGRSDRFSRTIRSIAATLGLLTASGLLVHLSGGVIETHFHFFVMVAVVSLYQDWTPFLLAIAFVVLHHGTVGVLDPTNVYNHVAAQQDPWRWAAIHGFFILCESVVLLVGWRFIEDASWARTLMERRLRQSERRFKNAFDNALSGMVLAGPDNEVVEFNSAFSEMLGYSNESIRGLSMHSLTHPDDRDRILKSMCDVRNERIKVAQLEHRFVHTQGHTVWVDVSFSLAHDAEDDSSYVVIEAQDISQRKRAEAEKDVLEGQLRQSQKMEAVGHLAGGVAHDFNNLLAVIGNYADFVAADLGPDSPSGEDVREIRAAASRGAQLTRQLLTFSRKEVVRPQVVDVRHALADLKKILTRTIGEHIDLRITLPADVANTVIDPGELEQVVMNLALNARDAMPEGGTLTIGSDVVTLDAAYADMHPGLLAGRYVCVNVSDTGTGMDREVQSRVFEPFFTTKERGAGTGLGLATVYGIATRANGHVTVYSEPGVGTTFRVYLPATEQPAAETGSETIEHTRAHGESILVVEDEPGLLRVACRILRDHGYHCIEASSGHEAMRLLEEESITVDLLLTDIVMPGMSGRQLEERSGLPTLYMSGYTDDIVAQQGVLGSGELLVQKPFTGPELISKVQEALVQTKLTGTVGKRASGKEMTRVLVVDDEGPLTEVIGMLLEANDFKSVWKANDPYKALDLARRIKPHVAIVDYRMPGIDGQGVASALREMLPKIKIILFSGTLEETPVWADEFVQKFQIADLPSVVRRLAPVV